MKSLINVYWYLMGLKGYLFTVVFTLFVCSATKAQEHPTDWSQLLAQKRYDQIISLAEGLLHLEPQHSDALYYRALALYQLGQREQATRFFSELLPIYQTQNDQTSRYRLAMSYFYMAQHRKAIEHLAALNVEPVKTTEITLHLAYAYAKSAQYQKAIAIFDSIDTAQRNYSVYYNRALAWYNSGELNKALADMQKAIELNPRFLLPYFEVVTIYVMLKQPQQALIWLEKLLETGEKDLSKLYHDPDLERFVRSEDYKALIAKY